MTKKLLLPLLLIAGTVFADNAQQYDGVAAYVDDKVITIDTVMNELRAGLRLWEIPPQQQMDLTRKNFPVFRDLLIERMLILKEYEASGAQLPNEAVNERVQSIIADAYDGNEATLRHELKRTGLTYPEWLKQVRENMIIQAMRHLQVNKKINVSPKRVREFYNTHPELFTVAESMHVQVILLPPEFGNTEAKALLENLRKGASFEDAAKAHSIGQNAETGGDLGFIKPAEEFDTPIVTALSKLKDGELSDLIEMKGCFVILKRVASKNAKQYSLKEAWPIAYDLVEKELGLERYKAWIEQLRSRAHIRYIDIAF
ncbi:MAG: peptidyl-prolyl cis-trans isomerase [Kiritimatiellae bacterium]|nr:peptidyl-prolyl cis-trans isomerase [Kiritimatiellia bacterium]